MRDVLKVRLSIVVLAAGFGGQPGYSQNIISTLVGTEWIFPDDGKPAVTAPIGRIINVAVDPSGNVLVADVDSFMIFRLTADGKIHVFAGNGIRGLTGDGGQALQASIFLPRGMVYDKAGNLYVAFSDHHRVRKITPDGVITSFAGGSAGFSGDGGPASQAQLNAPDGLVIDSAGNLYVAETKGQRIRKITASGIITTVAGIGSAGFGGDNGPALRASLNGPAGLAVDSAGNVYIADAFNNRVRKLAVDGTITTVAGDGTQAFRGDGGPAVSASLYQPSGVALDADGRLYIADSANHRVRVVANGTIRTIAGTGEFAFGGDGGPAVNAKLNFPTGLAFDKNGNLFIGDFQNARVRRIDPAGTITTVAGNGAFRLSPDGLQGQSTVLHMPIGIVFDSSGNLYIAESQRARVRKVTPKGIVSTVAGSGQQGFSGENVSATLPAVYSPSRLEMDSAGNLYISDNAIHRIRRVTPAGIISTVAGTGNIGFAGDGGPATAASLNQPEGMAIDSAGNLYIADFLNHRIRKVDTRGIISTFAGNGVQGFSGDNGLATSASLNSPSGLAVDSAGNVWIAERYNNRIRKVTSAGIISTVVGNGVAASTGDGGQATQASLNQPGSVTVDSAGNLYIGELFGCRIRRVSPSGIITTIAGTGAADFAGDGGLATSAHLNIPSDVRIDANPNIVVSDTYNNRVRVLLAAAPTLKVTPISLSFSGDAGGALSAPQVIDISSSLTAVPLSISTSTQDGKSWLKVSADSGSTPFGLQVNVDASQLTAGTYNGNIAVSAPGANPSALTISIKVTVASALPSKLTSSKPSVDFSLTQGAGSAGKQVSISNLGGGSVDFNVAAATSTGGGWLQVSPDRGTVTPTNPSSLTITATPGNLGAGTYSGTVVVSSTPAGETITVPVTMAVSAVEPKILLSQTGLAFVAAVQGGAPLPQSLGILNIGQGSMNWSARASTLSGGPWLTIDQPTGTVATPFTDVSLLNATIDARGLAAGDYYGQIQVSVPGAANSPQTVSVILNVLPLGSNPGAEVRPSGLIFIGQAGSSPGSQNVVISNLTNTPSTFGTSRTTIPSGGNWFVNLPTDATLQPSVPQQIVVQPDYSKLSPGTTNRGFLNLGFLDGTSRSVSILTVVAPAGVNPASLKDGGREASGCAPTSMVVQPTALNDPSASVALLQPTTLSVRMVDSCGAPITASRGGVASVAPGESQVNLVHIGDGNWNGTWQPRNGTAGSRITVQFVGYLKDEHLAGTATITVALRSGAVSPLTSGALNAASYAGAFISPGGLVSIFGQQLSDSAGQPNTTPFPTILNGTQVLLGGKPLPLRFVSNGQVNAQVPFELGINTQQQMVVQRGATISVPQDVVVAATQPAVYTQDQSGKGPGVIFNGVTNTAVSPGNPVRTGDVIVIYCNGLGAVVPPVPSGTSAPLDGPLSRTASPLTATIGGLNARVDFAGLVPGYPDLYQVNAFVPAGITPGDQVPVVLNIAGQSSPPVTIAVR